MDVFDPHVVPESVAYIDHRESSFSSFGSVSTDGSSSSAILAIVTATIVGVKVTAMLERATKTVINKQRKKKQNLFFALSSLVAFVHVPHRMYYVLRGSAWG